jgi:hypothetical protein
MTAPAPSSACSQEPQEVTPVKKRRGMLAFYVSTGVACLLLVGFYFAWTPIKIRYAASQLLQMDCKQPQSAVTLTGGPYKRWFNLCSTGAANGNTHAMRALVHVQEGMTVGRDYDVPSLAIPALLAQPRLFMAILDEHEDDSAEFILGRLSAFLSWQGAFHGLDPAKMDTDKKRTWHDLQLEFAKKNCRDERISEAAGLLHEYYCRRFGQAVRAEAHGEAGE